MVAPLPQISVLMLTRDHAAFIDQAIASVQYQSLWSAVELLIGDDGSSDGTTDRVRAWAQTHPERIRVWTSPQGALGFQRNFARLLDAARGSFVAFLEGDDWWCDAAKLECQLALLQSDPSLAFCGCSTRLEPGPGVIAPPPGCLRLGFVQLVHSYSFHFSAVLMRRQALELPAWILQQYCLDRPLYLLAARHGDAGVVTAVMSVYRQHPGGVWSSRTPLQRAQCSAGLFEALQTVWPDQLLLFRQALLPVLASYLEVALRQGQRRQALAIAWLMARRAPHRLLLRDPRRLRRLGRWGLGLGRRLLLAGVMP